MKVYIVCSVFDDGCIREFTIEGAYKSNEGAKKKFAEIVNNSDWFKDAENPLIEESFACSSKDYEEDKWLEVYIVEEDLQ